MPKKAKTFISGDRIGCYFIIETIDQSIIPTKRLYNVLCVGCGKEYCLTAKFLLYAKPSKRCSYCVAAGIPIRRKYIKRAILPLVKRGKK